MLKKEFWLGILGFTIIGFTIYGVWIAFGFFIDALASSDPKIAAAILGAMATIFVGLTAVIITQNQIKLRDREEAHRSKKVEIYEKYLETIQAMMSGANENVSIEAPSNQELVDYLVKFKSEIILWGSPEVIKMQLEFQRVSQNGGNIFIAVNNIHKAIRADIGLSNKGLNKLELVKMYLANPDELNNKGENG
ncbi:hypothetical protein L4C39_19505 [Vibrio clamense]|uniref:hypothetical protein n=1 Tax=Vibrio clamense TaxID=2910254 RepID=UPI003D1BEDFB